jgi:hypothetical protein
MDEIDRVIAGLTKAQREELLAAERLVAADCYVVRADLIMDGDKWPEGITGEHNSLCAELTPLGLSVRARLQERSDG